MNKILNSFLYIATVLSAFLFTDCSGQSVDGGYQVVPLPQKIDLQNGPAFKITDKTVIVYPEGNDKLRRTAEFLSEYLRFSTGKNLKVTTVDKSGNSIVLKAAYRNDNSEAYTLSVDKKRVIINGASEAGTFYGVQTLRKAIPAQADGMDVVLPAVVVTDYPRFGYRGMHFDVARHMFSAEFIKKYIDILALHNINTFHWHLTDDQGWRIEIKKYPKLTEIGAYRKETLIGSLYTEPHKYDGIRYGGFYTQDEIRDIVKYAQERFITIIPEIDLPGHMLAALSAYPDLGCTGGPYEVATKWGVFEDVLCVGNDKTFTFLEDVFTEVLDLFPSEYVHIGGDECPKTRWKVCPKCQARARQLGLKTDKEHTVEQKLQSYCMQRMEKFLNDNGRIVIGWDEILEGGLAPNAVIMSWRGTEGGITAAKQHHKAIMVPHYSAYLDYYQSEDTSKEPLSIGGYLPVEKVYSYEPIPSELTDEEKRYIIGNQANLWTEYIASPEHAEYMLLPRLAALSEVQWNMPGNKDFGSFMNRLKGMLDIYRKSGYNYAKHVYGIYPSINPNKEKNGLEVTLMTLGSDPIYYTTDGTTPTDQSLRYEGPVNVESNLQLKAIAVHSDTTSGEYSRQFIYNKATLKPITILSEPNPRYANDGAIVLVDGKQGTNAYSDGNWIGFSGNLVAMIDLEREMEISAIKVGTCVDSPEWIFGATGLRIEISADGKNFLQVAYKAIPVVDKDFGRQRVEIGTDINPVKARYVEVSVENTKKIPDWHDGKGKQAMLFVDEIEIH